MRRILSAFVSFCALALWLTGPGAVPAIQAQAATLEGVLAAQWGDPAPGTGDAPRLTFTLTDAAGVTHTVTFGVGVLEAAGGVRAVDRKTVVLTGTPFPADALSGAAALDRFTASRVVVLAAPDVDRTSALLTGSQPFVTILCKFSDKPSEPKALSYFNGLMGTTFPGMDHYWRETSYNNINIVGSQNVGWVTLPKTRAQYFNASGSANLSLLAQDCAMAADSQVYFPSFVGVNFAFNDLLDCCAWGGGATLTNLDGVPFRNIRATWNPPWAQNPAVFQHEMGHSFGFPHSSGMYGQTYDNAWDVMSNSYNTYVYDPAVYTYLGAGTITYHKDLDGWIPEARKFTAAAGTSTITLERLVQPTAANTYLMAKVPVPGQATRFYTVEARRRVGYDTNLPGDAIIIHDVMTNRSGASPALVVDVDGNGNTADAGAMFLPGETFNGSGGITIAVNSANATGWSVTITIPSPCDSPAISPASASVGNVGGSGSIAVTMGSGCNWTAVSNAPSWLSVTSGASGSGNGTVWYSAAFNGLTSPRTGTITVASRTFTVTQAASTTLAPGDMNGDGRMDLLWHHRTTGSIATWYMNGLNRIDAAFLTPSAVASPDWQPAGIADFNADGRPDVLWQNVSNGLLYVWFMNGVTMTDGAYLTNNLSFDPRWRVRGIADLNRDNRPDLVLQHPVDGLIAAWLLNGTTFVDGALVSPSYLSPDWRLAGAGDFNSDGKPDLVFQHSEGWLAAWYMDGLTQTDAVYLSPNRIVDTRWLLSAVGDVNGDGKPDLVLHHTYDGVAGVWLMNGVTQLDGTLFSPSTVPDANWRIVGPR